MLDRSTLCAAADQAARQIPPLWPLASSVAVNPFLGQSEETLAAVSARLGKIGAGPVTLGRDWYLQRIDANEITEDDLNAALGAAQETGKPATLAALLSAARQPRGEVPSLPTIAELAAGESGTDWPGIIASRIGEWAGSYFDEGQALWETHRNNGSKTTWMAYRAYATHDLSPEILGLSGFAGFVGSAPADPMDALQRAADRLGLNEAALESYLHQLLQTLGGWGQYARYKLWKAELLDNSDSTIVDCLAIRLLWEEALYEQFEDALAAPWADVCAQHERPLQPSQDDIVDAILQEAAERSAQRALAATLSAPVRTAEPPARPALQAAFCIDVRSEVFRRSLEGVDASIETLGFAGFFGITTAHRRFASDVDELRLPVLLNPAATTVSGTAADTEADLNQRYTARAKRAWGRFKLAAVSSFAYVEAMGPVYFVNLLRSALGLHKTVAPNDPLPRFEPPLDDATRLDAAETVLRAMSLTSGFARLVILAGHGASVVNNPHASGLHCGACGGYSGEVNARLLATLLNDPTVRTGLVDRGITLPEDTLFVGALHDTTTDKVTLYTDDLPASASALSQDLDQARRWLATAGTTTARERALRLPGATTAFQVQSRARNWAEVRPEWALAGCQAFIAAPRSRTTGRDLAGRAFLHNYAWEADGERGFPVLELILTAPVVVASWISLQYYGSSVAPQTFGGGNKLLHNVVGGIGVLEGNGGLLRAGLPWQSVHDGDGLAHEPLRLAVCVEAPTAAMSDILARHDGVRALFDNRWLHLLAMGSDGQLEQRYCGNLEWEPLAQPAAAPQQAATG